MKKSYLLPALLSTVLAVSQSSYAENAQELIPLNPSNQIQLENIVSETPIKKPENPLQEFKALLGQRYADVQKNPEKKAIWNKYWENAPAYVIRGIMQSYKQKPKYKDDFDVSDIEEEWMRDFLDYFVWMNHNNLTPADKRLIRKHYEFITYIEKIKLPLLF